MPNLELSFREASSPFHRMTPSSKLVFVIAVSFVAIFNTNMWVGIGLFVFNLLLAAFFTGVPLKTYWQLGKVILPFVLILFVVFPFFYAGQATTGSADVVSFLRRYRRPRSSCASPLLGRSWTSFWADARAPLMSPLRSCAVTRASCAGTSASFSTG